MPAFSHALFAAVSIAVSVVAFLPYAWGIYRGTVRPHVMGWLIWTLLTALVFLAQLESGGGGGAWTTGAICLTCLVALIAGWFRGERQPTRFDWLCLGLTLLAIPLWVCSGTPLYSVILLTFIELLGFVAMVPKTWVKPHSESLSYFLLSIVKYVFGALALDVWSLETALYPVATLVMAAGFCVMIMGRRAVLRQAGAKSSP